ncbi:MAG: DegT/DnrJ/EryC1/StrS family aminotransferase [Pirellulaceae bacterium]|nr:DegT/DnrJ/EryC1/StrS family aminotransferase [Pirellulaceae bacterium]
MKPTDSQQGVLQVPFFRPLIGDGEIEEVVSCLRSGWLTTGMRAKQFETEFAVRVGGKHAVALNSCTAALHLAVEALGLTAGQTVLVPAMTFASTAEVVRYQNAVPLLVDCDPVALNMDLEDAARKLDQLRQGKTPLDPSLEVVGIMPVHVGGLMMDMDEVRSFADERGLWMVEDAAHSFPAAYRTSGRWPAAGGRKEGNAKCKMQNAKCEEPDTNPQSPIPNPPGSWRRSGENTAAVSCFSFYANKTITTGEGGMAVTDDEQLAARIRQMSLHGLSHDAWKRFAGNNPWDYKIVAPGYKYNMTDIAAAIGLHQLARAENFRLQRREIARFYRDELSGLEQIELPPDPADRIHAWHLFPIRLCLDRLAIDRNAFIERLREHGVGCSVHWRPLHLHPYYEDTFGWRPEHLPTASEQWTRIISLPLFPGMKEEERRHVVDMVRLICRNNSR